jgi:hypothetical protein
VSVGSHGPRAIDQNRIPFLEDHSSKRLN